MAVYSRVAVPIETIRLWDVGTGDLRNIFVEHIGKVQQVAFSPTGQTLASTSDDGTIRIWNINTGDVIKTLVGPAGGVARVSILTDTYRRLRVQVMMAQSEYGTSISVNR